VTIVVVLLELARSTSRDGGYGARGGGTFTTLGGGGGDGGGPSAAAGLAGVSLNGFLHLEEWFFSSNAYAAVDSPANVAQGTVFPPAFPTPESLGFQWASEGDLVFKMQQMHGDAATIAAFKAHRDAYLDVADLDKMRTLGYTHVRLPVTWACFFGNEDARETIVPDPKHAHVSQVTVSRASLNGWGMVVETNTGALSTMSVKYVD
jgi:hypothetical protein